MHVTAYKAPYPRLADAARSPLAHVQSPGRCAADALQAAAAPSGCKAFTPTCDQLQWISTTVQYKAPVHGNCWKAHLSLTAVLIAAAAASAFACSACAT